ncbi:hypothetical protein D1Y84_17830 [Acidipila sp. EB88]|nr:hypothetical protein D1Y84_17830 [Acidipila sp. EB88]
MSHEMGNHSLIVGFLGEIERLYPATISTPTFNFNSGFTSGPVGETDCSTSGNSIASLLPGTGSSGSVPIQAKLDFQQLNYGVYVQDT